MLDEAEPRELHQAVSEGVADDLTQMMVEVVETGTGDEVQIDGVSVAGKTGTANTTETRKPYAWMVSFAPADDPQVAVAVLRRGADLAREDISGGGVAGPIAKAVMEAVIDHDQIPWAPSQSCPSPNSGAARTSMTSNERGSRQ